MLLEEKIMPNFKALNVTRMNGSETATEEEKLFLFYSDYQLYIKTEKNIHGRHLWYTNIEDNVIPVEWTEIDRPSLIADNCNTIEEAAKVKRLKNISDCVKIEGIEEVYIDTMEDDDWAYRSGLKPLY
jgi:hypothetical protein